MPNLLTAQVGLKLGPIVVEAFFKHYIERISNDSDKQNSKELMWDEAFYILKSFLKQATKHTVEELQEFSNSRIPAPPWIFVERTLVPLTSCDAAAIYLVKALGGEDMTKRVVGGIKWWQVRGVRGVDCEWICQRSHLESARRKQKERKNLKGFGLFAFANHCNEQPSDGPQFRGKTSSKGKQNEYPPPFTIDAMDGTQCMLYAHGGGYYFGSIDQERYCLQRYARKIRGRVFAVNYRLAPQYPFPCAIQDMLAAYLYLIDPPAGAMHGPVPPSLIVFGGDSAGGGLCLATLQVIRDSGLPAPAAAVLISPWCDLTHSFPSTIENATTDIIPPYGLSLHKPSVLWPPPPDEMANQVRKALRERFKNVPEQVGLQSTATSRENYLISDSHLDTTQENIHPYFSQRNSPEAFDDSITTPPRNVSDTTSENIMRQPILRWGELSLPWELHDKLELHIDGKSVVIENQIQFYAPNNLLVHPLISPALGYVGGLPPLFIIAGDQEVLRDEIIFLAHKAAHPDKYSINEGSKKLYPPCQDIEKRPTFVHLQVYDATAHVLPLFSFTTPAKYCYRAIALFINRFVCPHRLRGESLLSGSRTGTPEEDDEANPHMHGCTNILPWSEGGASVAENHQPSSSNSSLFRKVSLKISTVKQKSTNRSLLKGVLNVCNNSSHDSGDTGGNRFEPKETQPHGRDTAGGPSVYNILEEKPRLLMIRERVSTTGVLRPMEPESEIRALSLPSEYLGIIHEVVARRYLEGQRKWDKKFVKTAKKIANERKKNLQLAHGESIRTVAQFQDNLFRDADHIQNLKEHPVKLSREPESRSQAWSWVVDGEHPPPSSIVSRRDTAEARRLARIADMSIGQEESKLSGNRLWSILADFLTAHPTARQRANGVASDE